MAGPGTEAATAAPDRVSSRAQAVLMLQVFAIAVMVIPSDTVIRAIGGGGYPAALVGMFMFAALVAACLLGLHHPLRRRHPIRGVLFLLWLTVLASYVLMDRGELSVAQVAAADRMLMQLAVITGVALVAAECLGSLGDLRRVLRALCWGGAFCGLVAALQYWISLDVAPQLRELPGFSLNFDNPGIVDRGALNRVTGTAINPIELGVVAGMLLPLSIALAIGDTDRSALKRWAPTGLIALGIPTSVSRSAVLSVALALGLFIALMPAPQRLVALCIAPFALVATFMSAPGLIGTLTSFFGAGASDPSVATRLIDYPRVERLIYEAPWLGHGGGTYLPDNVFDILDNQYLKTGIELGLIGIFVLAAYFAVPVVVALLARARSSDPGLRMLCAALAGAALAGAVCSLTFDSLSFPAFANVHALVIGLIGAGGRLAAGARAPAGAVRSEPLPSTRAPLPAGG